MWVFEYRYTRGILKNSLLYERKPKPNIEVFHALGVKDAVSTSCQFALNKLIDETEPNLKGFFLNLTSLF